MVVRFFKWLDGRFRVSNHYKHFYGGVDMALCGTILMTAGAAVGMEFKDESWGGTFDWSDVVWTILGGLVGQVVQVALIVLLGWLCGLVVSFGLAVAMFLIFKYCLKSWWK